MDVLYESMKRANESELWNSRLKINAETGSTKKNISIPETLCCLLYTSPSPRDAHESRMPSSA